MDSTNEEKCISCGKTTGFDDFIIYCDWRETYVPKFFQYLFDDYQKFRIFQVKLIMFI